MTVFLGEDETTAHAEWVTPDGTNASRHLQEGTHHFYYTLKDGSDCQFTVTVEGKSDVL